MPIGLLLKIRCFLRMNWIRGTPRTALELLFCHKSCVCTAVCKHTIEVLRSYRFSETVKVDH